MSESLPLVSSTLVWQYVKKGTSFSRKNTAGAKRHFTAEPYNLTNVSTPRYTGFGNDKVVGVEVDGKGQVLTLANRTSSKPAKSARLYKLRLRSKRSAHVASGKVQGFRKDLTSAALARVSRIGKSEVAKRNAEKAKSLE